MTCLRVYTQGAAMADSSSENFKINFRFREEHCELGYPKRVLEQAKDLGMGVNEFARQKLIESLEDDRLDHLTALVDQLHSKVRSLEQNADRVRLDQKKGVLAILIHVCDMTPEEASRILGGDAPL